MSSHSRSAAVPSVSLRGSQMAQVASRTGVPPLPQSRPHKKRAGCFQPARKITKQSRSHSNLRCLSALQENIPADSAKKQD